MSNELTDFEKGYLMAQILKERARLKREMEIAEHMQNIEFKNKTIVHCNTELEFTEKIARKLKPELFKD
jgi:hypothetical protein